MNDKIFAKAVYIERLTQLVLLPHNVNVPSFSATGIFPLEKAEYLLTVMGLNIPIEVETSQY